LNADVAEQENLKRAYIERYENEYGIKLDIELIELDHAMRDTSKRVNNTM